MTVTELFDAYIGLLEGMRSPTWQKPSERKLRLLLAEVRDLRRRLTYTGDVV